MTTTTIDCPHCHAHGQAPGEFCSECRAYMDAPEPPRAQPVQPPRPKYQPAEPQSTCAVAPRVYASQAPPPKVNRCIIIDGKPVDEQTFAEFRHYLPNWYRDSKFGQLLDEFLEKRRNAQQPPKIDARSVPEPKQASEPPKQTTHAVGLAMDQWAFGLLDDCSVMYLSQYWIGRVAARSALIDHGCVRIGTELPGMSEAALLDRFQRRNWTVSGRLTGCESIPDAVRLGYLKIGRPE